MEWVQEWFWVESCSNKVHGRLPDCCNPTSTWPADQQFYPRVLSDIGPQPPPPLSYCDTLKKETADCGAFYTCVQLEAHSFSQRWLTSEVHMWRRGGCWMLGLGGSSCVSQESAPVFYISGRLCLCSCACVWNSVAVFMACQDVEVTVSCRVVCRPALQHHHPKQTNKQTAQDDIKIQNGSFDLWPQTWRQHQPDLPKIRGSFHTNLGKCPPQKNKD